ncbi:MAG TPA: glycosyltransferase family 2 protein [Acidobacteriota bacterium]|nr:glycosyltransferase family 2 protein [Acidobacteriota bacterium]
MQVSVTVITLNESARIEKMLDSVQWASEIVVVDCGSTDGTQEIARAKNARVLHHDFADYSSQKNHAQSQTKCEWVLNLDADEICTPELAREVQELPENRASAYAIRRKNYFQNRWIRHSGWNPDYKIRLYKKSAAKWEGKVHESVHLNSSAEVPKLNHWIEHHTYRGFDRYLETVNRYARLAAQQMNEQGKTANFSDLVFKPPAVFVKKLLLQGGILDGMPGFTIAALSAYGTFIRYALLREAINHSLNKK